MVRRFGSDSMIVMPPPPSPGDPGPSVFNLRDKLDLPVGMAVSVPVVSWLAYAAGYCAVWLFLAAVLFKRKEF